MAAHAARNGCAIDFRARDGCWECGSGRDAYRRGQDQGPGYGSQRACCRHLDFRPSLMSLRLLDTVLAVGCPNDRLGPPESGLFVSLRTNAKSGPIGGYEDLGQGVQVRISQPDKANEPAGLPVSSLCSRPYVGIGRRVAGRDSTVPVSATRSHVRDAGATSEPTALTTIAWEKA